MGERKRGGGGERRKESFERVARRKEPVERVKRELQHCVAVKLMSYGLSIPH